MYINHVSNGILADGWICTIFILLLACGGSKTGKGDNQKIGRPIIHISSCKGLLKIPLCKYTMHFMYFNFTSDNGPTMTACTDTFTMSHPTDITHLV